MSMRLFALVLLGAAVPAMASAQSVEIVFTPGAMRQAVTVKESLKSESVESFDALKLVGASADRKKEYADQVAARTAIVMVGEDAVKAVADIEFACPVILVNAGGKTAARNRVIRVYSADSVNAPYAREVSAGTAPIEVLKAGKEVALTGDIGPIVGAVVTVLKHR